MIPTAKPAEICIFQYNQIKGTKQEPITPTAHQWLINPNSNTHRLEMLDQRAVEISNDYLAAYADPVTGKLEWMSALMMEVRTKMIQEEETETVKQIWSIEHKKQMVSQFGTSKSKRKFNQMINNIIN